MQSTSITTLPLNRLTIRRLVAASVCASGLAACEVVDSKSAATVQDSAATPGIVAESARGTVPTGDSAATAMASPVSGDSSAALVTDDTTSVRIYPPEPRRGGVVFALAEGATSPTPRCTWKSAPLPCYNLPQGTVATIPLSADEEAGTFTLTVESPRGRLTRQITVADRELGRELIFLADSLYRRATSTREIARDARAVRGIASVESNERRWTGRWRDPVPAPRNTGYGVERYYYRASDSTRSIALDSQAKTRGTFAGDTSDVAFTGAPSWRHAGIDLPASNRAPVTAPAAGIVVDVGDYVLSGRTLLIDHGQGAVSAYFHLDTALVAKGDLIRAGQRIGRVGATGLSTGPHLHYGLYLHGKDVDPVAWKDMPQWLIARDTTAR